MDKERREFFYQQRVIRVFVSSTFRDMSAERDHLVKFVFPQLRRLCDSRYVVWREVDLRWGVNDEQKAEGKVLPICLAEIYRCRPYFIGLLGERYGWVPDEIPPALIEQEDWISKVPGHSVTHLEIMHGVLRNPDMANHAFFYFRDAEASKKLEPELAAKYPDYKPESAGSQEKLKLLKQEIEKSGFPVKKDYPGVKALGDLILRDFTELINNLYPEDKLPDPLDREALEHEAFARSRVGVYIGRDEYFRRLDDHAKGDGPPLVILGDSGIGKSALLSNWMVQYRKNNPDAFLLMHFIGGTPYSADWMAMLRRIMGEFKRKLGIPLEIPSKPDELRMAFANSLHMAAAKGRVILILDALNQLEDRDGAPDLVWLPPFIPPNVRLIVSTLKGRPLDDLTKREWPVLTVAPLTQDERRAFIEKYLGQYTKSLNPDRAEQIASAEQTNNPLYLQALLEELRLFGVHERLAERINHYLEAQTIPALYQKILARYEEDYENDRPGLVRDSMSLIWAARRGLSESELLDMLGVDGDTLPQAAWTPLNLAVESSLVNRSGLIGFAHEYLRQAVQNKYLTGEQEQHAAHLRIADYFEQREIDDRKVDELPWQLAKAQNWTTLYSILADIPFCKAVWRTNPFDAKMFWTQVEANTSFHLVETYRPVLDDTTTLKTHWYWISELFSEMGHPNEAMALNISILRHYVDIGDPAGIFALQNIATTMVQQGEHAWPIEFFQSVAQIFSELMKDTSALVKWAENINQNIQSQKGRVSTQSLKKDVEGILGGIFFAQANVLLSKRDQIGSMILLKKAEQLLRQSRGGDDLSNCLMAQAQCLIDSKGDMKQALALLQEAESLLRQSGNKELLACNLGTKATILREQCELEQAMAVLIESEKIFRQISSADKIASSLATQGRILADRGKLVSALMRFEEAEHIFRHVKDINGLLLILDDKARIQARLMRWSDTLACAEEAYQLATQLGWNEMAQQTLSLLNFARSKT